MAEAVQREFIFLWYYFSIQFEHIFKYWLIGMAVGSLVSVFGKEKIRKAFASLQGKKLGVLGVIPASLLGIASPLCMYGTIPIVASFAEKGIEEDPDFQSGLAAFMVSSILLNPQMIFYTAALGPAIFVIRCVTCFLCGITAGICVRYFLKGKPFFKFTVFGEAANRDTDPNIFLRLLKNFGRNVKATGLFLLTGIVLSVLFQRYVPQEVFTGIFINNRGFGRLMAATIGVPMYVCGGGTIPLILMWMQYGMSMGTVSSFMIAGPAMKITNLGALKIVLGIKHFIFYILFSIIFALICGIVVDQIIINN